MKTCTSKAHVAKGPVAQGLTVLWYDVENCDLYDHTVPFTIYVVTVYGRLVDPNNLGNFLGSKASEMS